LQAPVTLGFEAPEQLSSASQPSTSNGGLLAPRNNTAVSAEPTQSSRSSGQEVYMPPGLAEYEALTASPIGPEQPLGQRGRNGSMWVVAEEVVFKPSQVNDEFVNSSNNAPSRPLGAESCWQPSVGSGLLGGVMPEPTLQGAKSSLRNASPPPIPVPSSIGHGGRTGPPRRAIDRSPLRWLAPVLGTLMGESCAQDGGHSIDFPSSRDSGRPLDKPDDNWIPWVLGAVSPSGTTKRAEEFDMAIPHSDMGEVDVDADPLVDLHVDALRHPNGHPSRIAGYVSQKN